MAEKFAFKNAHKIKYYSCTYWYMDTKLFKCRIYIQLNAVI